MRRARRRKAPRIDPTTIPAIWPPDKPGTWPALVVAPDEVELDGVAEEVLVLVKSGCSDEVAVIARTTPEHRISVLEKTQHESVAFGELAAQ